MKKSYILFAALLLAGTAQATVLTVNNNTPSPGQYISLTAAVSAATAGDTLYISGSPYNYNSVTITKPLTLIGTGHKPQSTTPVISRLDNIDFSGNADGTRIIGLDVYQVVLNASSNNNMEISRCKIRYYIGFQVATDNLKVEGNYFENAGLNIDAAYYYYVSNCYLRNNVFNGYLRDFYGYYGAPANVYVKNNIFLYNGSAFNGSQRNLIVSDNIFYGSNAYSMSNGYFNNNITYGNSTTNFPSGNTLTGNLENTDPMFVSAAPGAYDYNNDYRLAAGSPAINAGSDGTDIGITGGDGYFDKYGIPAIPQIRDFKITSPANATINPGGTLQISVISTIKR